jgi:hypothetical protein
VPLFGNRDSKESLISNKIDSKPQFTVKTKLNEVSVEVKDPVVKPPSTKPMIGGKKEVLKPTINTKSFSKLPTTVTNAYHPILSNPPPAATKTITDSKLITEEELEDENSVKDGSYFDGKSGEKNSNNETITL